MAKRLIFEVLVALLPVIAFAQMPGAYIRHPETKKESSKVTPAKGQISQPWERTNIPPKLNSKKGHNSNEERLRFFEEFKSDLLAEDTIGWNANEELTKMYEEQKRVERRKKAIERELGKSISHTAPKFSLE